MKGLVRWVAAFAIMMGLAYGLVVILVPSEPSLARTPLQSVGSIDLAHRLLGRADSLDSDDPKPAASVGGIYPR